MKAAITLLILGLLFIHGEALRCRQSNCNGIGRCISSTTTCREDADHCFTLIMTTGYRVSLTRGCATETHCMTLKSLFPNTICCTANLCN